eukprot:Rhum_TRINITY_DN2745_c0_g1::Rhum_TRINITY_DN2745_c0_g1_i1::g.8163::m.8163
MTSAQASAQTEVTIMSPETETETDESEDCAGGLVSQNTQFMIVLFVCAVLLYLIHFAPMCVTVHIMRNKNGSGSVAVLPSVSEAMFTYLTNSSACQHPRD